MDKISDTTPTHLIPVFSTEDVDEAQEYVTKYRSEDENRSIIGTHSGVFHWDEVLGWAMLKFTKEYKNPAIIRSRNPEVHKLVDILLDVGDIFDPEQKRFDHHQRSFDHQFYDESKEESKKDRFVIKMSSAGLIYKYYGQEIIKNLAEAWNADLGDTEEAIQNALDKIHKDIYSDFIKEIDAIDNGVSQYKKGQEPRYKINTGLGTRIGRMNPEWNSEDQSPNKAFQRAMAIGEEELILQIHGKLMVVRPAYNLVKKAFESRKDFHESGEFLFLETTCPWKSHLFQIEEETKNEGLIKFVFFKDNNGMSRVQAMPLEKSAFENRISLYEAWRGKREEELSKISGLEGIKFVHHSGFIGGANDINVAIKMAEISIEKHNEEKTSKMENPEISS